MPLFFRKRKPSEESKKRLEYQLCLSKEVGADDILDISACELTEVPASAFSTCKVLQKKVFILHSNQLKSLVTKGCSISSLATLRVLDLHENKLTSLPDEIGQLKALQVLNLERNHLHALPESIGDLLQLQTLNVKGNALTELPSTVGWMGSLRTLDISENNVIRLPTALAKIRTLECLTLDAASMTFPPSAVCAAGTEATQRFLCAELGMEYCPPSQYLLPVLESEGGVPSGDCVDGEVTPHADIAWENKFQDYEKRKERKQMEKLEFERRLEEEQREQTELVLQNSSRKEDMLQSVRQEQQRLEQGLWHQQKALEVDRQRLLAQVRLAESSVTGRITRLLLENKRQRKSAEFLQALEEDRMRVERLMAITQEEAESLRRKEVAAAMQKMLSESCSLRMIQEVCEARRRTLVSETCSSLESLDRKFEQVLSLQQLDKNRAISHILQEEEMQKAAFETLQLQKDSMHCFLRNQEVLSEQRSALSDLLQQLLKQRDQRETELRQLLVEMELKSEATQENYWLIQYQRLLDAKPLSLRMQEAGVEQDLVDLLCKLSAQQYLPLLAHHRVTAETLRHMTPADLQKMGISEMGIQKALLNWAKDQAGTPTAGPYKDAQKEEVAEPSVPSSPEVPSPPPSPEILVPSAPSLDGSSECVVCMEKESQTIFLPCGHVCCCQACSDVLLSCPLCRGEIAQRVRIYRG
ncbi:E3 ubiquitin-protein ligase LRSAM1 isoform X2 [Lepisosteus oculatus]|uniref:E3 ubiquitin-protein ligase LRSAM1 isoform X2 n=1 Tax=Lepisosteus oculatus TaxID=7918 RepID=UPI00371F1314